MKAAVTRGGALVVDDIPEPVPSSGHVVARSLAAGICGSDLHALGDFAHFTSLMGSVGVPALDPAADCVFGHEFCAEIVEHGPDTARTLPVGSRVCSVPIVVGPSGLEQIGYSNAYPGALAEHMVLQELLLIPVPDSVPTELAALTEPLAVGEHAVGLAGLTERQPCLVVGCGPVGLAVIAALKGRGHGPVLAADFSRRGAGWRRPSERTKSSIPPRRRPTIAGPTSGWRERSWSASEPPWPARRLRMRSSSRRWACRGCSSRSSPTRRRGAASSWSESACRPMPLSRSWR